MRRHLEMRANEEWSGMTVAEFIQAASLIEGMRLPASTIIGVRTVARPEVVRYEEDAGGPELRILELYVEER